MKQLKPIMLCADDFGLNAGISKGILNLVHNKRLSAVSCLVTGQEFKGHAKELLPFNKEVQVGLHFNLTEGKLLTLKRSFGLKNLLLRSHLGLLKPSAVMTEFQAQLDAFTQAMGCLPHFIDGHQHVHQFPGIRPVILDYYGQHLKAHSIALRSTYPALSIKRYALKTNLLAWTGGMVLHAELKKLCIPHNPCFAGVYNFAAQVDYRSLFRQWLAAAVPNTLIMCHPGERSNDSDVLGQTRWLEMNYLLSDEFLADCQEQSIALR